MTTFSKLFTAMQLGIVLAAFGFLTACAVPNQLSFTQENWSDLNEIETEMW